MKRRQLIALSIATLTLAACGGGEDAESTSSASTTPLSSQEIVINSDVYAENAVIFGTSSYPDKEVFINISQQESKDFVINNLDTLKNSYNDIKSLYLYLDTEDDYQEYGYRASIIGIVVYLQNPELFWDYLNIAVTEFTDETTSADMLAKAKELGLDAQHEELVQSGEAERLLVEMRTKVDDRSSDTVPSIAIDETLWEGDINNTEEVNTALTSDVIK